VKGALGAFFWRLNYTRHEGEKKGGGPMARCVAQPRRRAGGPAPDRSPGAAGETERTGRTRGCCVGQPESGAPLSTKPGEREREWHMGPGGLS
jgi:hypothetical protein